MTTTKQKDQNNKHFYINNKDFYDAFVKWNSVGCPDPVPEDIVMSLYKMVDHISQTKNFVNYSNLWLDEMKSDAFFKAYEKVRYFNVDKSVNPFSYFTTVIRNCFIIYLKKRKKEFVLSNDYINNIIESRQELML